MVTMYARLFFQLIMEESLGSAIPVVKLRSAWRDKKPDKKPEHPEMSDQPDQVWPDKGIFEYV